MSISSASFSQTFPSTIQASVHSLPAGFTLDKTGASNNDPSKTVEADFLKEAQKTPAQRMQEALLKKLGITPEEFDAMDADQKSAITGAIKDELMQQIKAGGASKTGNYTDMMA